MLPPGEQPGNSLSPPPLGVRARSGETRPQSPPAEALVETLSFADGDPGFRGAGRVAVECAIPGARETSSAESSSGPNAPPIDPSNGGSAGFPRASSARRAPLLARRDGKDGAHDELARP